MGCKNGRQDAGGEGGITWSGDTKTKRSQVYSYFYPKKQGAKHGESKERGEGNLTGMGKAIEGRGKGGGGLKGEKCGVSEKKLSENGGERNRNASKARAHIQLIRNKYKLGKDSWVGTGQKDERSGNLTLKILAYNSREGYCEESNVTGAGRDQSS